MKILILCGGYGTRLAPAAGELPKPMVPIGGRPIVWHIMRGFSHWGFHEFVLCLGYRADLFKQYFLNLATMVSDVTVDFAAGAPQLHACAPERNWTITLAETGLDTQTGARVKQAARYVPLSDDLLVVTYGDGVSDVDVRQVIAFHRRHGRLATVMAVHPPGQFGELALDGGGRVAEFNEKPHMSRHWISGGFFVFSRAVLDRLGDRPDLVLEREPLQQLARDGELMAYRHEHFWYCMDSPRDHQHLSGLWSNGRAPWTVWERG